MNMKITFLNEYLEKDIYIEQSLGFISGDGDHRICKLQRSIYGLKQAFWSWNHHFDEAINVRNSVPKPIVSLLTVVLIFIFVHEL